ncbi:ribose transport system permease protein [Rhizobium tibeticum]|uniref:Monosaccharide ABC transporter membrane protein, CUT2 family n=1 Tax=Rhizobium tibeticum TaxID=501024 RepID=A0A1H8VJB5_9HYPH|nr:ABC transporter permease [Rhizobium tibeticum]MDP9811146.1 ribose transport system permease protein [Rhizobium tibeticum]SEI19005.1 Ribose transport system permease protein RbsC [Rhizobium tibeticum]SEP15469.1 monosaccharide ABC transporter membrane protein, CUT2 family [Rhizobium tibeticum]
MSASTFAGQYAAGLARYGLILALVVVFSIFSAAAPTFLTLGNLQSILVNNFTLLAIVSIAMTLAVSAGGIDLSVGTAVDFASFAFVSLVLTGEPITVALLGGLTAGAVVGAFNAILISAIGVSPFLATLGTLFIGRSIQQLLTNGGNPVYLPPAGVPEAFRFLGHGFIAGVPVPLLIAALIIAGISVLLSRTRFGRVVLSIGIQPSVVRYSGVGLRPHVAATFILAGIIAAVAGIILTATVTVYIPSSGNAFLLNAIGATFIGTTFSPLGRPNVGGTVLGVLLLSIVANGLLLSGLNFYWQQVGTGTLIFAVLAFSFINRKAADA